jgi:hypothetical protein
MEYNDIILLFLAMGSFVGNRKILLEQKNSVKAETVGLALIYWLWYYCLQ